MINLHYEFNNIGSNSVVVFLHGWGLNGNSFDPIISRLKNSSYVKIDFYGFGQSDEPKEYFDAYEYAYQIFLLLKKLEIEEVVLVGHSFGGRIAILLSSVFQIQVKNLVLTSSAGVNKFNIKTWIKIRWYKILKLLNKFKIVSDKKINNCGSVDYKNASIVMRKILIKVVNQDLKYLLKNILSNTLLVWDKKDKDTPYYICKTLRSYIKDTSVILYKTGGHFAAFYNVNKFSLELNKIIVND